MAKLKLKNIDFLASELKKYCITPLQLDGANENNSNARLTLKLEDISKKEFF